MKLQPGSKLGSYEILSLLGSGGMGEVYRARDSRLGRVVAIKILPPETAENEERRHRFGREARAASALSHPNVATIFEFGESEGCAYIVMELVDGEPLSSRIGNRPLESRQVVDIALQACEALEEAHARGITHRDVKPGNIMITPQGRVKVLDFGLARIERKSGEDEITTLVTQEGKALGTVPYMSPEQAMGRDVDGRSDIFSLGTVIYEMATGARPFTGGTATEVTDRILHAQPMAIARLNYDVPPELERIVRKCLEKDRERRYQSARDVAIDLRNLKRDLEFTGQPHTPAPSTAPAQQAPYSSSLLRYVLIGLACALLAAAGVWGIVHLRRNTAGGKAYSSIAVLPLKNLSGKSDQEWFSDGMTESLIAELSRIKALKVISSTSVMQLKDTHKKLPEIGRDLDVETIVEGSVLRVGDNVRITASLIEAASDHALWSHEYDSDLKDVLTLQREVARTVADEINVVLSPAERATLSEVRAVNPATQDALLKGSYYYNKGFVDSEDFRKALASYEEAAKADPQNAEAFAGIAKSYGVLGNFGLLPQSEAFQKSRDAALHALELDDNSAEAHKAMVWWHFTWQHDWPLAEREIKRALELNPNDAEANNYYAQWLSVMGRHEEAISRAEHAHQLAPLSMNQHLGLIYHWARRYDDARRTYMAILELDEHNAAVLESLMELCLETSKPQEAWEWKVKTDRADPNVSDQDRRQFAEAWRTGGWPAVWREEVAWWDRSKFSTAEKAGAKGWRYAQLGEADKAFAELEIVYREHGSALFWLHDPVWDPIRNDPRFKDLRRRVNLPPE